MIEIRICEKCKRNPANPDSFGFCDNCLSAYRDAYNKRTFEHTCFQCGQKKILSEAIWKAFGWAVSFGIAQTSYHCDEHKPFDEPKIMSYNRGHQFNLILLENNLRS